MPKKSANIIIRGLTSTWSLDTHLSDEEIAAMRADGVPVGILHNSTPGWVAKAGFTRFWCWVQDALGRISAAS